MNNSKPFGLNIHSEISLPGCGVTGVKADVRIRYGAVPDSLPGAVMIRVCTQTRPGQFLLTLDRVAKYLVEGGTRITIEPAPGVNDDEVRLFLMGAVWSALLLQRGLLPLHGSAIRVKDGAVVFAGPSGNGKSTLAAALMERGHPFVTDELCALDVKENSPPTLLPGFPQIQLWADSLRRLDWDIRHLAPVRPGLGKFVVPLENDTIGAPLPVARLYVMVVGNKPSYRIKPLQGRNRIYTVIDCTYRVKHVAGHGLSTPHFKQCCDTARHIDVKRLERPMVPFDLESLVNLITGDF